MASITLNAPAKVNLFLKILGRRRDGYNELYTIFERISLYDEVTITAVPRGITVISNPPVTKRQTDNIAYKAAEAVIKEFGLRSGVKIRIKKRIPVAAGLGGGSSDAASVILGMDRLFGLKMGRRRMFKIASGIGADVPFFVLRTAFAIGTGSGERLKCLNIDKNIWHLLIYPGFGLSTKRVYRAFDGLDFALIPRHSSGSSTEYLSKYLTGRPGGVRIQPSFSGSTDLGTLEAMLYNDLQCAAISEKKVLGSIIERLTSSLGKKVILSGSGPSVFCLCRTRKEAVDAGSKLRRAIPAGMRKRWKVFVVKTEYFKERVWRSRT